MPKITRKLTKNFTILPNEIITNKQMSSRARLTLITMLCLPDDWNYTEEGLMSVMGEGRSFVRNALNELESLKYLEREMIKENGRYTKTKYTIYQFPYEGEVREHRKKKKKEEESPSVKKSSDEIQSVEKPSDRKPSDGKSTDGESSDRIPSDRKSTDEKNTLQSTDSPSKDEVSTDIPSTDSTNPQSINTPEEEYKESKYEGKEEDSISINKGNCSDSSIEEKVCEVLDEIDEKGHAFPYGFDLKHKINSVEEVKKIATYFFQRHYAFFHEDVLPEITWFNLYETAEEYCVTDGILYKESVYKFDQYKEMIDLYFDRYVDHDGRSYKISNFMKKDFRERLYREIERQSDKPSGIKQYRTPPRDFPGDDSEDYGELPFS